MNDGRSLPATDLEREAWVARRLGASHDVARRLAMRLEHAGRLADGAALVMGLHATRRGTELASAATALAEDGTRLPSGASDYERRTLVDEVDDAWRPDEADPEPPVAGPGAVVTSPAHLQR